MASDAEKKMNFRGQWSKFLKKIVHCEHKLVYVTEVALKIMLHKQAVWTCVHNQ
jgi:hypothetical protein